MSEIPLGAEVECLEGPCGKTITIIINPTNKNVTHIVVRDKTLGDDEDRLIPIEHLGEFTEKQVRLNIRRDEMTGIYPFVKTRYLKTKKIDLIESFINGGDPKSKISYDLFHILMATRLSETAQTLNAAPLLTVPVK